MTKRDKLKLLKLLSAFESWTFSVNARFPDYLAEGLTEMNEILTNEILEVEE